MKISIVITTYNLEKIIEESVLSFINQSLPREEYELIVVDDGSTDTTPSMLDNLSKTHNFTVIHQENSGVSHARNVGASHAAHEVILFSQGDICVDYNALKIHYNFHDAHPPKEYALVGYITWHHNLVITPFMRWLENGGPQFDFNRLTSGQKADYLAFYTPHVSLKRSLFIESGGFDESFVIHQGMTAYEDTELAWRLHKLGMKLFYDENAIAYHYHAKTLESVTKRRFYEGQMSKRLYDLHTTFSFAGSLTNKSQGISSNSLCSDKQKTFISSLIINTFTIKPLEFIAKYAQTRFSMPLLFKLVCRYYYNKGMQP